MLIDLLILIVLVFCSAFFSLAESAFMAVSRLQAETLAKQQAHGAAALLKLKEQPRQFIITILIGNNLVNTAASALATVLATKQFGSAGVGIATGAMTFILLTIGEIFPKSYATTHSQRIALLLAPPGRIVIKIFYPLVILFEWITNIVLKMFSSNQPPPLFSEAELRTLVELGVKEQRLGKVEKDFIVGVLEFHDCRVSEIMTPKRRVFSLASALPLSLGLAEINRREHTRIPIYSTTKEKIIGIIYLKDIVRTFAERKTQQLRLQDLARKPLFVAEDALLINVFREMQAKYVHIAIVVNARQEMQGVITLEDILEEIVGEIFDEKDISPILMKRVNKKTIVVHGDTRLIDINIFFGVQLVGKEGQTLQQWLQALEQKPFQEGMHIKHDRLTFIIKEVEDNKAVKVIVKKW